MSMSDFDRQREQFDKDFANFDKKVNQGIGCAAIVGTIGALLFFAVIVVAIYLALKNWG